MANYCSRQCQVKAWKQQPKGHKSNCIPMEDSLKGILAFRASNHEDDQHMEARQKLRRVTLEGDEGDAPPTCSLCAPPQALIHPVVLETCGHVFCFPCLQDWNRVRYLHTGLFFGPPACPLCRQEIPEMPEILQEDIGLLLLSARSASESYNQKHFSEALAKIELFKEILEVEEDDNLAYGYHSQLLSLQYAFHMVQKQFEEAMKVAKEIAERLRLAVRNSEAIKELEERIDSLEQDPNVDINRIYALEGTLNALYARPCATPKEHVDAVMEVAMKQKLLNDWSGMYLTLIDILCLYQGEREYSPGMTWQQQHDIFTHLSRCCYELGDYETAIERGLDAISMCRIFPDCHKYVVLAYLATSNHEAAQQRAADAVIYEVPWDEEHRALTLAFYREHFMVGR